MVRQAAPAVLAPLELAEERTKVELVDRVGHEVRQVPLGQPVAQRRPQEQALVRVVRLEGLAPAYSFGTDVELRDRYL